MELFRLLGTIAVDNASALKGIDQTTDAAEKSHGRIASAFGKVGKAAAAVGVAVGAAAVSATTAITKMAVSAYADYEQLVGGVNTLFKDSSAKVQQYAANAYKTAGLSANQYMETVTSFSASLLQSLGGDTEKAADVADMAITDMADNANKMGTSIEMIQNAYQGFAKQNYTMLDNLKLGYGGTKEEMARLIEDASRMTDIQKELGITVDAGSMSFDNIANAIHIMQTKMGIAGATLDEAEGTISGSLASMKSAWQNFLVGLADGKDMDALTRNLATSIVTVGKNLIPRVVTTVKSIGKVLVDNVKAHGGEAIEMLGRAFTEGIPMLVQKGGELIVRFSDSLKNNFPQIVKVGLDLIAKLALGILNAVPSLISSVAQIGLNLVQGLWNGIVSAKDWVLSKIKGFGKDILNSLKSFFGIHSPSRVMEEQVGKQLALGVAQGITKNTEKVDKAAEEMGSRILDAAEQTLKEYKRIHKLSIHEEVDYWAEIVLQTKKGTQARIEAEDKYFDALARQQQEVQELEEEKRREREQQLEEYKRQLEDFQEEHKSFVEQIMKQTDLFDPFKIAEEAVSGEDLIANLQSQVDGLENYNDIMEALEKKIGSTKLMDALREFGTDSLAELTAISKMTDEQLEQYVKLYDQKYALADATAEATLDTASKVADVTNKISAVTSALNSAVTQVNEKLKSYNGVTYDPTIDYQAQINRLTEQGAPADVIYSYQKKREAKIAGEGLDPVTGAKLQAHAVGGILTKPTIFGYTPSTGTYHLGGEAGKEAIAPIDVLQGYVKAAVAGENRVLANKLDKLDIVCDLLEIIARKDSTIELDGREFGRLVKSYA